MKARLVSCASLLALVFAGPCWGQSAKVYVFKFAPDPAAVPPVPHGRTAAPRPRAIPRGLPGFYDPATATFTPLAPAPPPSVLVYNGTYTFFIGVEPGNGIENGDTVFCTATISFGNVAGTPPTFFSNHTAEGATNFGVGDTGKIQFPFTYIPTAYNSQFVVNVECEIPYAADGTAHSATFNSAEKPVRDGNIDYPIIARE